MRISIQSKVFLRSSAFAFVIRAFGALAGFLTTGLIAREFGAQDSGYYFLALTTVSILAAVSRLGLDNTLIRFVGRAPEQAAAVFAKSVFLVLMSSILLACCLYFSADFLAVHFFKKTEMGQVLSNISIGVVGVALFTLAANALQGLRRVMLSVIVLSIIANVVLIISILVTPVENAAELSRNFACAALFSAGCGAILFYRFKPKQSNEVITWFALFRSCLPLWGVVIMGQLVQWSGLFVAGAYVSGGLVAQLAVAQRTAMLASFVLFAVNLVVAPRFAALHRQGDMQGLQDLTITSVRLIGLLAIPVVAIMLVFPSVLMGFFGEDFSDGAKFLQILAVGQFVSAISGSVGFLLMMCGFERDMRNITLVSGTLALVLTWFLTANFGAVGNAIGTAVAVATQNLLAVYFVRLRLGFNTLAIWRK
jgi:O-antigen/teichoic acid export membrane protein